MRRDWLRGLRGLRDERGSVMVLAGLGIAATVGLAAFTVDLSNAYAAKGRLQNAADAAALAAVASLGLPEGQAEEAGRALALEFASLNVNAGDGAVSGAADVAFGRWQSETKRFQAGVKPYNAVRVTTRRTAAAGNPVRTYFGGFFGVNGVDVEAEAIAVLRRSPCVFALDPSASGAFETTGTAAVRVPECGIQVNSRAPSALIARGASSVAARSICVGGGYSGRDISPLPDPDCRLYPDPLAALPEPATPGGCYLEDVTITRNLDLPAGTKLCGRIQIASTARVRLDPGIYYFENAHLHLAGSASIEGDDVMLYFDRNSSFHLASQGSVRLTPPQAGAYRGLSIFQSRRGSATQRGKIAGGRELHVGGTIYVPRTDLEMAGHSGLHGEMRTGYVIANSFRFVGAARMVLDLRGGAIPAGLAPGAVLVE